MHRHTYLVVTTNFDLTDVLRQFMETYPNGAIEHSQIVFQSEKDTETSETSYIIVFTRNTAQKGNSSVSFWEYIGAYCKLKDCYAIAASAEHIFPSKPHLRVAGRSIGIKVAGNIESTSS